MSIGSVMVSNYLSSAASFSFFYTLVYIWGGGGASPIAQSVNHLPAVQEIRVRFLGQEDPLEMEMATHFSILAWGIPWIKEPSGLQSMESQESDMT